MTSAIDVESEFDEIDQEQNFGSFGDYDAFFEDNEFEELGIDPQIPTDAKPGSDDKVVMLAARYAAGLPLWHNSDRYDHGPNGVEVDEE